MSHHTTENQVSNTVGLVMIAALAGAAAALLFAPKKGTDIRDELKGKYKDMTNRSQETAEDMKDKAAAAVESASTRAKRSADKAKDAADQANEKAKNTKKTSLEEVIADETDGTGDTPRTRL